MNEPPQDERNREYGPEVYFLVTGKEQSGRIVCYKPGLKLIDFYRTIHVLAKDEPKDTPCSKNTS